MPKKFCKDDVKPNGKTQNRKNLVEGLQMPIQNLEITMFWIYLDVVVVRYQIECREIIVFFNILANVFKFS